MRKNASPHHHGPAWAQIDLSAIRQNFLALRKVARQQGQRRSHLGQDLSLVKTSDILPVIKSEAYGHGLLPVAKVLIKHKAICLAVSDVTEGIALRQNGIRRPILLFESTLLGDVPDIVRFGLTPCVGTEEFAKALNAYAASKNKKVRIHLKIDTGMSRLGVSYQQAQWLVQQLRQFKNLQLEGIMTHFPLADKNAAFTRNQVFRLTQFVEKLAQQGIRIRYLHAANSMGLAGYQNSIFNLARPGLMLYGLYPHKRLKTKIKLRPAMEVKARILMVKPIPRDCGVSYGHTFVAPRAMTIAVIPIGYSNGYSRLLSNRASVLIDGKRCPVVGNVTMDQIMVDVSRVQGVKVGQEVVILGRQKTEVISADELAGYIGTINYEIVCSLGNQLPRIYKD